jgi:DNA repair exonuclease SbcCD nuclease subunit
MKLAHLADLHLGFRQYHRQTPEGINQREADVALVFRRALQDVVACGPDLVVIAGDLFHSVRPPNGAIVEAFVQLSRLRAALPDCPILIIAGNHDTPRSVEAGSILKLFEEIPGVAVATKEVRRVTLDHLDASVVLVPHAALAGGVRPELVPSGPSRRQILVAHGEVAGVLPGDRSSLEYGGVVLEPKDLHLDRWTYVALGHYHVAHEVAPNAWYSGALEYVSPNPWGELKDEAKGGRAGKGWLLVDMGEGIKVEFRPVPGARRLIDLEPIDGRGREAEEISLLLRQRVERVPGGIEGQVVRQVVYNVPRLVARDLDHALIREYKSRALHYHLDVRRPPPRREVGVGSPGRGARLEEIVADFLKRRVLPPGMDRRRLIELAVQYLAAVEREGVEVGRD